MKYISPTFKGKILNRYKRFLADIKLEEDTPIHKKGDIVVAHTANTGSMKTCWGEGWDVIVSYHDNPKRKLKYSLELTHNGRTWIGVNTSLPNKLALEAIKDGTIKELQGYHTIKPEEKIGDSRIDLYLYNGEKSSPTDECFVEIKNVTLLGKDEVALFPDSVSVRGQKHLKELIELKRKGIRACMLYIVQRQDVKVFSAATDIDPLYSELLSQAYDEGVEVLVYQCKLSALGVEISHSIDFRS